VESTFVEVLILSGLGESGIYKVVIRVGLEILVGFEGPRGEGA
jgi:hypothetical protein